MKLGLHAEKNYFIRFNIEKGIFEKWFSNLLVVPFTKRKDTAPDPRSIASWSLATAIVALGISDDNITDVVNQLEVVNLSEGLSEDDYLVNYQFIHLPTNDIWFSRFSRDTLTSEFERFVYVSLTGEPYGSLFAQETKVPVIFDGYIVVISSIAGGSSISVEAFESETHRYSGVDAEDGLRCLIDYLYEEEEQPQLKKLRSSDFFTPYIRKNVSVFIDIRTPGRLYLVNAHSGMAQ